MDEYIDKIQRVGELAERLGKIAQDEARTLTELKAVVGEEAFADIARTLAAALGAQG